MYLIPATSATLLLAISSLLTPTLSLPIPIPSTSTSACTGFVTLTSTDSPTTRAPCSQLNLQVVPASQVLQKRQYLRPVGSTDGRPAGVESPYHDEAYLREAEANSRRSRSRSHKKERRHLKLRGSTDGRPEGVESPYMVHYSGREHWREKGESPKADPAPARSDGLRGQRHLGEDVRDWLASSSSTSPSSPSDHYPWKYSTSGRRPHHHHHPCGSHKEPRPTRLYQYSYQDWAREAHIFLVHMKSLPREHWAIAGVVAVGAVLGLLALAERGFRGKEEVTGEESEEEYVDEKAVVLVGEEEVDEMDESADEKAVVMGAMLDDQKKVII